MASPEMDPNTPDWMPHVLVVEDDRASADALAELMGGLGFEVCIACNGEEALSKAFEFLPDVVLLDIGLPVRDGYEVALALREIPDSSTSFIVAVTGHDRPEDEARSQQAGIDIYLTKPIDVAYLKAILIEYRRELEA